MTSAVTREQDDVWTPIQKLASILGIIGFPITVLSFLGGLEFASDLLNLTLDLVEQTLAPRVFEFIEFILALISIAVNAFRSIYYPVFDFAAEHLPFDIAPFWRDMIAIGFFAVINGLRLTRLINPYTEPKKMKRMGMQLDEDDWPQDGAPFYSRRFTFPRLFYMPLRMLRFDRGPMIEKVPSIGYRWTFTENRLTSYFVLLYDIFLLFLVLEFLLGLDYVYTQVILS